DRDCGNAAGGGCVLRSCDGDGSGAGGEGESADAGGADGKGFFADCGLFGDCGGELSKASAGAHCAIPLMAASFELRAASIWLPRWWSGKVCADGVEWVEVLRRCDDPEGSACCGAGCGAREEWRWAGCASADSV